MLEAFVEEIVRAENSLVLVSDPDEVLGDEAILSDLAASGFRVIVETDLVLLRARYEQTKPITSKHPLIVITTGPLNQLPYDLWQQSNHVELALHQFFRTLDYPTLRTLSPGQRHRLAQALETETPPDHPLSSQQTQDYLLRAVFDATPAQLTRPPQLLLWLDRYHAQGDSMPPVLAERLLEQLQSISVYADWPLPELLASPDAFRSFVQDAWGEYVTQAFAEGGPEYVIEGERQYLDFAADEELQDILPRLVRSGALTPLQVAFSEPLPTWAVAAVAVDHAAIRHRQVSNALSTMQEQLEDNDLRWEQWQVIAHSWAQLLLWRFDPDHPLPPELLSAYDQAQARLDQRFGDWLTRSYTPLATRRLPKPHHLFHVPGYMAHTRQPSQRIALLIMDGMALADWLLIRGVWHERHPAWQMQEQLLLAQIPSITAISRQALVSGLRPAQFVDTLIHNRRGPQRWKEFWRSQGLSANASALKYIPSRIAEPYPAEIDSMHTRALCCIASVIDKMLHGATQGAGDLLASIRVWLQQGSPWLEGLIQELLDAGYTIYLTSDHGHVAAIGYGQPHEGVTVETRSKRARIYDNEDFVTGVREQYPETILWHGDGLLPQNRWVLMPNRRQAFAPAGERVVSHGGLTIEEMVVPVVIIEGQV